MALNLTLSPSQLELVIKPGGGLTQAYQVTNNSDSSIVLYTTVEPWRPDGPDGSVSYENIKPVIGYLFSLNNSNLTLGQSFVLKPKESRQLVLKIKSLPEARSDGYFTFFLNQDQSSSLSSETDNQVGTIGRLGSHILISSSTTPETNSTFTISGFKSSPRLIDLFFPKINFTASVNNTSSFFNRAPGKITISKNNSEIKTLETYPDNILANSSRSISCLSPDKQPVACTLSPPFWPGPYTAVLKLDSGAEAKTTFFVFPYTIFITILIFSLFYLIFRKLIHRLPPS